MKRFGATGWLVLALSSMAAPAAVASPIEMEIEIAAEGCAALPRAARIDQNDRRLWLEGEPHREYVGWLEEHGIDVELAVGDDRWITSSPIRRAREPLRLRADADGHAIQPVRVVVREPGARLQWHARCDGVDRRVDAFAAARAIGEPAGNLAALGRAAAAALVIEDPDQLTWWRFQLAGFARSHGMQPEAAGWYVQAGAAAPRPADPVATAMALLGEGQTRAAFGDRAGAATLEAAREQLLRLRLAHPLAVSEHDLCLVLRVRGQTVEAADCQARSARQFARIGERESEGRSYRNQAVALLKLGRYGEARAVLDQSARIAAELGNRREQAMVWRIQAQLERFSGNLDQALALLGEALAVLEQSGDAIEHAHTHRLIAQAYLLAGQPERAVSYHRLALARLDALGSQVRSASTMVNLAHALEHAGRPEEARGVLAAALPRLRRYGSADDLGEATLALARLHLQGRRHDEARVLLAAATSPKMVLNAQDHAQAEVLAIRLDGDRARAEAQLPALMEQALQGSNVLHYLELAAALVEQRVRSGDAERARELSNRALGVGESIALRLQSPGLRHALLARLRPFAFVEARLLGDGELDPLQARAVLAAPERLRSLEQRPAPIRDGSGLFDDLERVVGNEALQAHAADPERRNAVALALDALLDIAGASLAPEPLTLTLPTLKQDQTLLYFIPLEASLGVLVLQAGRWRWHGTLDAGKAARLAQDLHDALASGERNGFDGRIAELAEALQWSTVLPAIPKRLYVVGGGPLAAVPWDMLLAARAKKRAHVGTEVVLLQSLRAGGSRPPASISALAAAPREHAKLDTLRHAESELDAVLASWPQLPRDRHVAADHVTLERALTTPDGLVHVATHGRADAGLAEDAGLWLLGAGGQPQFLSALRLRRMKIGAALVVLSACESGRSGSERSFGVGGVGGSLVDAGAAAVIATRWPVSDRAAMVFSRAFHAALGRQPDAPAAALRQAQQAVRELPALRAPTHWAGWFMLQAGPEPTNVTDLAVEDRSSPTQ